MVGPEHRDVDGESLPTGFYIYSASGVIACDCFAYRKLAGTSRLMHCKYHAVLPFCLVSFMTPSFCKSRSQGEVCKLRPLCLRNHLGHHYPFTTHHHHQRGRASWLRLTWVFKEAEQASSHEWQFAVPQSVTPIGQIPASDRRRILSAAFHVGSKEQKCRALSSETARGNRRLQSICFQQTACPPGWPP